MKENIRWIDYEFYLPLFSFSWSVHWWKFSSVFESNLFSTDKPRRLKKNSIISMVTLGVIDFVRTLILIWGFVSSVDVDWIRSSWSVILSNMQPPDARLEPVGLFRSKVLRAGFGWTDDDIISVGVETTEEGTGVYNKQLIFRMYEVENITSYEHLGNRLLNWIRWTSSNGSTFWHFDCSIIRRLSPRVKSCGKRQFFFTQWPKERHKWSWLHPLVLKEHFPARKSWHILIWEKRFGSQEEQLIK